jgi:hypothetical protein
MYCDKPIDTSDAGWGFIQSGYFREHYHTECIQIYEGIEL